MQHRVSSLTGYTIRATDGDLGKVDDFYFDDKSWVIRYLVVDTGNWLSERKVLIAAVALGKPDCELRTFSVNLTRAQVRNSPDIDTAGPIFRQHEAELHDYYQWPRYWEGGYGGALGITPYPLLENPLVQGPAPFERPDDPHLRSTRQVMGYQVHATDDQVGQVDDLIVDDENWMLRFLVVDTGSTPAGRKIIIPPARVLSVNWPDASVHLDFLQESIKDFPDFDPLKTIHRNYTDNLSLSRK